MKLLIAGDLVPTQSNQELFAQGHIEELLGKDLYQIWDKTKYKLFNLETPICKNLKPIKKTGPNLQTNPIVIKGIKALNPSLISLANNHIMDYGEKGCKNTLDILTKNRISYVGVGTNKEKLKKYFILKDGNLKIGIYSCCETEFSNATRTTYGANYYDEFTTFDDVKELKKQCNRLIVLYHGGKEYYRYPSPRLQKLCRKLVDSGADIVVCQHSHAIGSVEKYHHSTIVYGQGNFIFDRGDDEYWNTGMILEVTINKRIKINYLFHEKQNGKIRLLSPKDKKYCQCMDEFMLRNQKIKDSKFINDNYNQFADKNLDNYLKRTVNKTFFYRLMNKITKGRYNHSYREQDYLQILNLLQCEAHNELFIRGLKNRIGMKNEDE